MLLLLLLLLLLRLLLYPRRFVQHYEGYFDCEHRHFAETNAPFSSVPNSYSKILVTFLLILARSLLYVNNYRLIC